VPHHPVDLNGGECVSCDVPRTRGGNRWHLGRTSRGCGRGRDQSEERCEQRECEQQPCEPTWRRCGVGGRGFPWCWPSLGGGQISGEDDRGGVSRIADGECGVGADSIWNVERVGPDDGFPWANRSCQW